MPKECLECHYYLYIHVRITYTGFFMEGTVAKMPSKLNRATVFNKLPSGQTGGEFVCYTFLMVHMTIII